MDDTYYHFGCLLSEYWQTGMPEEIVGIDKESPNANIVVRDQSSCRSRARLTRGGKLRFLNLFETNIHVSEIARRFSCGENAVYKIVKIMHALEMEVSPEHRNGSDEEDGDAIDMVNRGGLRCTLSREEVLKYLGAVERSWRYVVIMTFQTLGDTVGRCLLNVHHKPPTQRLRGLRIVEGGDRSSY